MQLLGTSEEILLTVSDLGGGFDSEAAMQGEGLGLTSMKERLKLVNGQLSIDSQPKHGTTIQVASLFVQTAIPNGRQDKHSDFEDLHRLAEGSVGERLKPA